MTDILSMLKFSHFSISNTKMERYESSLSFHWEVSVLMFSLNLTVCCCNAGFIAMYATLASRDVDCCLIPESPFYLEGEGGLYEYIEKRLKENGHMVIVIAEGGGQTLFDRSIQSMAKDASGNKLLPDVGQWLSQSIKVLLLIHT